MRKDTYFSSESISKELNVTYKTIQTDIESLKESLKVFPGVEIVSKRGYGYRLKFKTDDNYRNFENEYKLLTDIRGDTNLIGFIALTILFNNDTLSEHYITTTLHIDRKTIQHIVKRINLDADKYNLSFVLKSKEVLVEGEELAKRMFFMEYYSILKDNNFIMREVDLHLNLSERKAEVKLPNRIEKIDDLHDFYTTFVVLSEYRTKHKFTDDSVKNNLKIYDDLSWHLVFVRRFEIDKEIVVPEAVSEYVDQFFNVRMSSDIRLFEDDKASIDYLSKIIMITQEQQNLYYFPEINEAIFEFNDFQIALELGSHLMVTLQHRLKLSFVKEHLFVIAIAVYLQMSDASFDRRMKIAIYAHKNKTLAALLKKLLLREYMGTLEVEVVDDLEDMKPYELSWKNSVLLITDDETKRHPGEPYFILYHSDLADVKYLKRFIDVNLSKYYIRKREVIEMFDADRFTINAPITNMGDVISMVASNYIEGEDNVKDTERFVFMRERRYFSVVNNGLAAPRVYVESEINSPQIEVVIPENSFYWNDKVVKLILVIIIPRSFEGGGVLGIPFETLMSKKAVVNRLAESNSYLEFIQLIGESLTPDIEETV